MNKTTSKICFSKPRQPHIPRQAARRAVFRYSSGGCICPSWTGTIASIIRKVFRLCAEREISRYVGCPPPSIYRNPAVPPPASLGPSYHHPRRYSVFDKAPSFLLLASASIARNQLTALWGDNAALQAKVLEVVLRSMAQEVRF